LKGEGQETDLPLERLCHNGEFEMIVILNEVKNLIISTESIIEILRLMPQNDITTQSLKGEVRRGMVSLKSLRKQENTGFPRIKYGAG
jgi:hypothetical protein